MLSTIQGRLVVLQKGTHCIHKACLPNMILMHMDWWRMTHKWEHNECDLTFSLLFFGVNQRKLVQFQFFFFKNSTHFDFLLPNDKQNKLQVPWYEISFSGNFRPAEKKLQTHTTNHHFLYVADLLVIICIKMFTHPSVTSTLLNNIIIHCELRFWPHGEWDLILILY